ncbi:CAAX amino terminal protease self- immunity [Rubripirellula obstinata]|uniref:CAAX amino terminal protease self-immunity n=1 Tax=Rubripirellula obstinata TaxID=406547 RepID=A0A5B1CK48_9BACT|nr:type II CAAX endopeptidase family protein [Rubripirellula obstinata]KAA1259704.1 CAAX amino terminal protease self- immunity [Rubripirellula obstinata]
MEEPNPYANFDAPQPEMPQPVEILPTPRYRLWTVFAIVLASIATFFFASVVFTFVAIFVVHGELSLELLGDTSKILEVSRDRLGLFIMVVLPQFALVLPAIIAARLSPTPLMQRLSLVRGHWPIWVWFAAALATPLVGLVSSMVCGMFLNESESLKEMSQIFRDHGASGFLIPLSMMIGLTPAVCEELLFRGYIQTRLVKAWHPIIGILIASFLFAIFHMDLVHVIAVFPMGVFLGWVSWRSGSLIPAMMGHFVNNVISVVAVVMAPEGEADVLAAPVIAVSLAIIALGIAGMSATVTASIAFGPPPADESAGVVAEPAVV